MPRVLIAGCGYLGRAVADLLAADRWEVEAWTMSAQSAEEVSLAGHSAHSVDISNAKDVAARQSGFDAVVHCASTRGGDANAYRRVYFDGARNLLDHLGKARFLFVSSTSVYAQTGGDWVTEESAAEPQHETGKILRKSEDLVLDNSGVVIRLGGLYGPGRSALLRKFLNGEATIDPENDRFVNQVHRDDAAAAVQFLLRRGESGGQICNLVDNQPMLLSECYRWLAIRLNRSLPATAKSMSKRKRGESNKRVSNARLRSLGWGPRYPTFADGMESVFQTVDDENV